MTGASLLQALNVGTKRLSFDHRLFQLLPLGGRTQRDLRALVSRPGKYQISMLAGGIFHDPRCGRVSRQICQPQNWRMKLRQFCENRLHKLRPSRRRTDEIAIVSGGSAQKRNLLLRVVGSQRRHSNQRVPFVGQQQKGFHRRPVSSVPQPSPTRRYRKPPAAPSAGTSAFH